MEIELTQTNSSQLHKDLNASKAALISYLRKIP